MLIQKAKPAQSLPEVVRAHLPSVLLPNPDQALGSFEAAVLLLKIEGVTDLTAGLMKMGQEGAEQLGLELNTFLGAILELLAAEGGQVLRLEGDEVLACFPQDSAETKDACFAKATRTSQAIMQLKNDELQVQTQLDYGEVEILGFGQPGMGREWVLVGPISSHSQNFNKNQAKNFINNGNKTKTASNVQGEPSLVHLIEWLPPAVWQRLKDIQPLAGNWQRAVAICVQFEGPHWNEVTGLKQLNEYYNLVQKICAQYNGLLYRFQPSTSGEAHRLTLLFGTFVSGSDDAERALRVGLLLRQLPDYLPFIHNQGVGVASSTVYAGLLGTTQRQQFVVVGNALTGAATAAQASTQLALQEKGSLLVDHYTSERVGRNFLFGQEQNVTPQSKKFGMRMSPLLAELSFELALERIWKNQYRSDLLTNHPEWAVLMRIAEAVLHGTPQACILIGPEGSGKSALLKELADYWLAHTGTGVVGRCYQYGAERPYLGWAAVLAWLCGFVDADTRLNRVTKINTVVAQYASQQPELITLLQQILEVVPYDHQYFAVLAQPSPSRDHFFEFFLRLIEAKSIEQPLLIGLENMQWSDQPSQDLIDYLLNRLQTAVLFGFTSRKPLPMLGLNTTNIELQPLTADESQRLIEQISTQPFPDHEMEQLITLVGGNPHLTIEAVRYWQHQQRLPVSLEELALFSLSQ